jgi:hypothetical protein
MSFFDFFFLKKIQKRTCNGIKKDFEPLGAKLFGRLCNFSKF